MSEWAAKRFWTKVEVCEEDGVFCVTLDGRHVRTPSKAKLTIPSRQLAEWVAAEWEAQVEKIDPESMPVTRAMNSAIDKVAPQFDAVCDMLVAYGGSDLLCYRADAPEGLVARQTEGWDPVLDWAAKRFGVQWNTTQGVMHVSQPEGTVTKLGRHVANFTPVQMTAFHDLVALSGSLVLALAVTEGALDAGAAWALSRIDETWQTEQWGKDEEAEDLAETKRESFELAARIFDASAEKSA